MLNWGFGTAESLLGSVFESVRPAVKIVEGPLQSFDRLLCGGLDAVEQRVPSIYLPPKMVRTVFGQFYPNFCCCFVLAAHIFFNLAQVLKYLFTDLQQYQGIHVWCFGRQIRSFVTFSLSLSLSFYFFSLSLHTIFIFVCFFVQLISIRLCVVHVSDWTGFEAS